MFTRDHPKPIQKNGPDVVQVVRQEHKILPSTTTIVIEKKKTQSTEPLRPGLEQAANR